VRSGDCGCGYWNIKGWGHFVVRCCTNFFVSRLFGEGRFRALVAPLRYHQER